MIPAMPSLFRHFLLFVLRVLTAFVLAGAAHAAFAGPGPAPAPREITLLIVDASKADPIHAAWHRAFADHFNAALARAGADPIRFSVLPAAPREAVDQLRNGGCDAALLISDDRPWTMRRHNGTTLAATLSYEPGHRSIFLFLGTQNAPAHDRLSAGFAAVLADETFQALVQGRLPVPQKTPALAVSQ
jgi:hypothetical protein